MNKDAVQHERGPRNSTLRRQMALYYGSKESDIMPVVTPPMQAALDLVLPKTTGIETGVSVTTPMIHPTLPVYSTMNLYKHPISTPTILSMPRVPVTINDTICEQAARLLFMNVTWARDLNMNSGLCMDDQLTVLEASWRELFLLAAAQCVPTLDPSPLLPGGPQSLPLSIEASRFRETLVAFHSLNLNAHEYSCLRAVVLYKAGLDSEVPSSRSSNGSISPTCSKLKDVATVVRLRESAQTTLGSSMATSSFGAMRFSKLILMLPMLKSVSSPAIEEFFFRRTIGLTPIEKIICDVYTK
ncbi:nuclear receptor subfamily 2 group E member 1 [Copidosoma floridanum]|uniref:nuclear receptor subfamily 2 group E member 1 n=1 Tax=Copidosoma floridanum TaxID=29053 RepID=UPI000C6F4AB7|nr:nuclear receptor subfamily 2 group E member 1 [Copidosoma floridanum]